MIEKMCYYYVDFIKKYGFLPLGFVISPDIYSQLKKELGPMHPAGPDETIPECDMFLGIPITICSQDCGIAFQMAPRKVT